jgi:hypothetical protein
MQEANAPRTVPTAAEDTELVQRALARERSTRRRAAGRLAGGNLHTSPFSARPTVHSANA